MDSYYAFHERDLVGERMLKRRGEDGLSQREAKAVRSLIRKALPRPEWKVFQAAVPAGLAPQSGIWTVHDLTADIAPGVQPSERLGRQIRVHRVDVWSEWRAPQTPVTGEVWCGEGLLRAAHPNSAADDPADAARVYDDLYDNVSRAAAVGDVFDPRIGPFPQVQDLEQTLGWYIYRHRKWQMQAASHVHGSVMDSGTDQITGATTFRTSAQDFPDYTNGNAGALQVATNTVATRNYLGQYHVIDHARPLRVRHRISQSFPGKGLLVTYTDVTDSDTIEETKRNHLYYFAVSSIPGGAANSAKPYNGYMFRIWFTDE